MPTIFEKTRLLGPEFARYIYKGAGGTRDMNLAGYKHAIVGIVKGTEVKKVEFHSYSFEKTAALDETKKTLMVNMWVAVVVSVTTVDNEVYEGCGEANLEELKQKKTENNLVRIAESRARKRAYAQALGISPEDFFADKQKKSRMEDIDTPMCDLDAGDESQDKAASGRDAESVKEEKKKLSLDDLG
jgi:hypothetical protein